MAGSCVRAARIPVWRTPSVSRFDKINDNFLKDWDRSNVPLDCRRYTLVVSEHLDSDDVKKSKSAMATMNPHQITLV